MALFTAVYSHRDDLLLESREADYSKRMRYLMLTYSATDTLKTVMLSSDLEYFEGIVRYGGMEVSILLLPNGFKIVALFEGQTGQQGEERLRAVASTLVLSILDPAFDENVQRPGELIECAE